MILNPFLAFSEQLWGYLSSEVFKIITASLILPLLIFLFENIFKIRESLEEKQKRRIEEQKDKQLEVIQKTNELWKDFFNVAVKIRYFKAIKDDKTFIIRILNEYEKYRMRLNEVTELLNLRFPNIIKQNLITFPFNVFGTSIFTIANLIKDCESGRASKEVIRSSQDALEVIMYGMTYSVYKPLNELLFYYMILDAGEYENRDEIHAKITKHMDNLEKFAELAKKIPKPENKPINVKKDGKNYLVTFAGNKFKAKDLDEANRKLKDHYYKLPFYVRAKTFKYSLLYQPSSIEELALNMGLDIYKKELKKEFIE